MNKYTIKIEIEETGSRRFSWELCVGGRYSSGHIWGKEVSEKCALLSAARGLTQLIENNALIPGV